MTSSKNCHKPKAQFYKEIDEFWDTPEEADIDEMKCLRAAAANSAFDFLKEPEEDIYTLADERPFYDQAR